MKRTSDIQLLLDAIRRIVQMLNTTSREAEKKLGVSASQLFVLHKLKESGPLSIGELAARTFTHQSSVSVVVAKLHKRKFVVRYNPPKDARRTQIDLSAAGRVLLKKAPNAAQDLYIRAFERMTRPKQKHLAALLTEFTLRGHLGAALPPMLFEDEKKPRRRKR